MDSLNDLTDPYADMNNTLDVMAVRLANCSAIAALGVVFWIVMSQLIDPSATATPHSGEVDVQAWGNAVFWMGSAFIAQKTILTHSAAVFLNHQLGQAAPPKVINWFFLTLAFGAIAVMSIVFLILFALVASDPAMTGNELAAADWMPGLFAAFGATIFSLQLAVFCLTCVKTESPSTVARALLD